MDRRYELDRNRIFACLMVVVLHTAASGWHIDPALPAWRIFNLVNMAVRAGVPLFFMISGALFLPRKELPLRRFLLRNGLRLLVLYGVWSALYELNRLRLGAPWPGLSSFLSGVARGHYHLRFLLMLAVAYLLLPAAHSCIHGKRLGAGYLLGLFGLAAVKANLLLVPRLPEPLRALLDQLDGAHAVYVGYMVLGYWLSQRRFGAGARMVCPAVYAGVTLLAAWGNRWYSLRQGEASEWLYGYLCAATLVQAVCCFSFFQSLRGVRVRHPGALQELSACTLGVYLLHPFVLETLARHRISAAAAPAGALPLLCLLVLAICLAGTFVLRRIPGVRQLIS